MKSDVVFPLENAAWPALLVNAAGTIVRANGVAVKTFGSALEGEAPLLSSIWAADNGTTAEHFLSRWERSPAALTTLKFLAKGGVTQTLAASLC